VAEDEEAVRGWARLERNAVSPSGARELFAMLGHTDVRNVLPAVSAPTLVLHRKGDRATRVGGGRYLAENIAGARYIEFDGDDHVPWTELGCEDFLGEIEEFLTGERHPSEPERVLATVMFSDIVDSTRRAAALGDRVWGELLASFYETMRRELEIWRGTEIDTAGDGLFASFDGPARAIRCACAARDAVAHLGLAVRIGLHTGECEMIGDKIGGIAVHTGARVAAQARPDEVLVSSTVRDLVAGSGLAFEDRGGHELKGLPGTWQLYSATA
jgi:class 3 adenylate cyclase